MSMNAFHGIGRITRDLKDDVRYTKSGVAVVHFTLAIDRNYKNRDGNRDSDFVRCEVWGFNGRNGVNNTSINRLVSGTTKGSRLGISGSVETGRYQKNGQYVYTWAIRVNDYTFLDPKPRQNQQGGVTRGQAPVDPFNQSPSGQRKSAPSDPFKQAGMGQVPQRPTNRPQNNRPANPNPAPNNFPQQPTGNGNQNAPQGSQKKQLVKGISDDDLPF